MKGLKPKTGAQSPDKSALFAVATDTGKHHEVKSKQTRSAGAGRDNYGMDALVFPVTIATPEQLAHPGGLRRTCPAGPEDRGRVGKSKGTVRVRPTLCSEVLTCLQGRGLSLSPEPWPSFPSLAT